jgi:hypothetical protein
MLSGQNEAFSRVLIDKALGFSGWDLLNPQQVQFESHTSSGRADYLLKDSLGRVLCVLEAITVRLRRASAAFAPPAFHSGAAGWRSFSSPCSTGCSMVATMVSPRCGRSVWNR